MKNSISNTLVCSLALILLLTLSEANGQAAGAPWIGESLGGEACRGRGQGFGPYDYLQRQSLGQQLQVVETIHFTSDVANLVRGKSGRLEDDLDYTLRAWPNHHSALYSMMRFQQSKDQAALRSLASKGVPAVECYLLRALDFSPKDDVVPMLMGILLQRKNRYEDAVSAYERAISLNASNIQAKYNLGLLYLDMGFKDEAETLADEVYSAGFPLAGLKRRLSKADAQR